MPKRAERRQELRRQLALYRRYLAEGVDIDLARVYLAEINRAELELKLLELPSSERP